ncbi:Cti6 protein [Maudiozyma humilis]|uniref:Cti6 protein n=1 Tax=Maudiozyma humilis TaxID=51915 RepID=A0AAV5RUN1_MAUHU|nr:hypothetical protein DAKH74_011160 [Kazachstania humilis]GMM55130.1 Cti6 protein [Kazachstania humilis]
MSAAEEDEEITRCVCGEQEPADESGLYIQCEECSVWQHGFCVGIVEDVPDEYWCEKCKPELHRLYTDEEGRKRSHYLPVQGQQSRNSEDTAVQEGAKDTADTDIKTEKSQSPAAERLPEDGKQGDADQGQGQGADSTDTTPVGTADSNSTKTAEDDTTTANGAPDNSNDTTKAAEQSSDPETDAASDSADGLDAHAMSKRASRSSREEQQYQRMLEQAIKESQRDAPNDTEGAPKEETPSGNVPEKSPSAEQEVGEETPLPENPEDTEMSPPATERQTRADSVDASGKPSSSEDDAGSVSGSGRERQRPVRKPQRVAKKPRRTNSRRNLGDRRSRGNSRAKDKADDVSTTNAVKPRLPSQRTSINEMRRRTSAILEFISRTQWDLENMQKEREDLVQFVENDEFVKKIDVIFSQNNNALEVMNDLTQKLLNWEKQYGGDR